MVFVPEEVIDLSASTNMGTVSSGISKSPASEDIHSTIPATDSLAHSLSTAPTPEFPSEDITLGSQGSKVKAPRLSADEIAAALSAEASALRAKYLDCERKYDMYEV